MSKKPAKNANAETQTGKFLFKNGSKYEGEYVLLGDTPQRQGQGVFIEALCVQDKFDCPGFDPLEVDSKLAQTFSGTWNADQFIEGSVEYPNGSRFEGKISEQGYQEGKYYFADGEIWDGPWKDSKMNGEGIFIDKAGVSWKGVMVNNIAESMIQLNALE